jgi:hypothetical protein
VDILSSGLGYKPQDPLRKKETKTAAKAVAGEKPESAKKGKADENTGEEPQAPKEADS